MPCARSVLLILLLLAGSLSPPRLWGQGQGIGNADINSPVEQSRGFNLEQNYPTPVNPETWIPFNLDPGLFAEHDTVVVTMRIYNLLFQLVAIPEMADSTSGSRRPILNVAYARPGRKVAYWDGRDSAGRRVPTGVYYCQLVVDDEPEPDTRKIIVLNPGRRRGFIGLF